MSLHSSKPGIPDACPICDVLMRSNDLQPYERNEVCADCEMSFLQLNRDAWQQGWRPSTEQVFERLRKRQKEPFFYRDEKHIYN